MISIKPISGSAKRSRTAPSVMRAAIPVMNSLTAIVSLPYVLMMYNGSRPMPSIRAGDGKKLSDYLRTGCEFR
jgi:hypothetical protein